MKSEKGITLISLVIYMSVFVIVLAVMSTITNNFFANIEGLKESPKYVEEFNKFSMFFIKDAKSNSKANVTNTTVEFEDGTKYEYKNNCIYRNETLLAKNVKECTFIEEKYQVNTVTKNLIKVNSILGSGSEEITRNIDFVLKYW